jgi:hypothetical protein
MIAAAAPASAQWLRLGTWDGSVEGLADYSRFDSRIRGERSTSEVLRTEERLELRNIGAYILHPGLVNFSLGGTFGLFQEQLTFDGDTRSDDGRLVGYDLSANVLAEQPLALTLFANRNESIVTRELAGRSEILTETRGATLFARRLYIPSTFTFRQELHDEEVRVRDVVAERSEERRTFTYHGQRGWVDAEMELLYEFIDFQDRVFGDLSYRSHEAQLNHGLDFGAELNRHWDSRLRVTSRTGLIESTVWSADELLRIDHTPTLWSDYRYTFLRTDTSLGATTRQSGQARLQHQLYESLTTTGSVDAVRVDFPEGERDAYRVRGDAAYTKRLPLSGRLDVTLNGSVQYEDDRFRDTRVSIVQESHTAATPFALPIALNNRFVDVASVVVTRIAAGPLPAGCVAPPGPPTPLTPGIDFTLRTVNDTTEIVPIPCLGLTAGINPGDTILVDYTFTVSPSLTFTTTTWLASVNLDFNWVRLFYTHDEIRQDLLAGRDGQFLDEQVRDTVGAELRYDRPGARASVLGEATRFRSIRTSYDSLRGTALASVGLLQGLTLTMTADALMREYRDQRRETVTQTARAGLTYVANPTLFVDATAGIQRFEDTGQPTEELMDARLLVRWMFRKLEFNPTLEILRRERGDTLLTQQRALLRVIRRF